MTDAASRREGARQQHGPAPYSTEDRRPNVVDFLTRSLVAGAVPVEELEVKARRLGLLNKFQSITHAKSFRWAKDVLGIKSIRKGFGPAGQWSWAGPDMLSRSCRGTGTLNPDIPSEWIDGVARLDNRRAPEGIRPHRWLQLREDSGRFLRAPQNGAARAAALGWDTYALFGSATPNPLAYLGSAGLLWTLNGGRIAELHRDWAVVEVAGSESRVTSGRLRIGDRKGWLAWQL
jgi:hypothetical protein